MSNTDDRAGKRKRGQRPFMPTPEDRYRVKTAVAMRLSHDQISLLVLNPKTGRPIDKNTLEKHFREELAHGTAQLKAEIGEGFRALTAAQELDAIGHKALGLRCDVSVGG
jgi:hypothetical protein